MRVFRRRSNAKVNKEKCKQQPLVVNKMTTYIDDRPLVSRSDHSLRENLRHEIRGDPVEPEPPCAPVVEITGLELLMCFKKEGGNPDNDDESYESFARDSVVCAKDRLNNRYGTMLEHFENLETHAVRRVFTRRLSNCSSIGEDDSEVLLQNQTRRGSFGSYANDSLYRGGKTLRSFENSFSSSFGREGKFGNSSGTMGSMESSFNYRPQRRLSINTVSSYANDSIEYKSRFPRRSSMDSYANDSVFGARPPSTQRKQQLFQQQQQQVRRFSNYSDFATDSVEAARNGNDRKKLQLGHHSNHEIQRASQNGSLDRRTVRRASMTNMYRPPPARTLLRQRSSTGIVEQSSYSLTPHEMPSIRSPPNGRALVKQCSSRSVVSCSLETQTIVSVGNARAA